MLSPFLEPGEIDWEGYRRLIDFYIKQGAHGLFAACLSSESHFVSATTRVDLVRVAVEHSAGRVPVVGGVMGCSDIIERSEQARAIISVGAEAAVIPLGEVVGVSESDGAWIAEMDRFLDAIPEVTLGLYECPVPYKRMLTDELSKYAAKTGRFAFIKETSGDLSEMRRKLATCSASGLKVFSANDSSILDAYAIDVNGYSGLQTNLWTDLHVKLFECRLSRPDVAQKIQTFLTDHNWVLSKQYPASAKRFLSMRMESGISTLSFLNDSKVVPGDDDWLNEVMAEYEELKSWLAAESPADVLSSVG